MRLYRDRPDVLTPGRWQWCPKGAKPIPYLHVFTSCLFDPEYARYDESLGEVRETVRYFRSPPPDPRYLGQNFCGSKETWTQGALYSQRGTLPVDEAGVPLCCVTAPPAPGGAECGGEGVIITPVLIVGALSGAASLHQVQGAELGPLGPFAMGGFQPGSSVGPLPPPVVVTGSLMGLGAPHADPSEIPVRPAALMGLGAPHADPSEIPVRPAALMGLGSLGYVEDEDVIPPGTIFDYAGAGAPSGYLVCDGTSYSASTYPDLAAILGGTWDTFRGASSPGTGNFRVPDLRGLVTVGVGAGSVSPVTNVRALGQSGGEETHQLTDAENGPHVHVPSTHTSFLDSSGGQGWTAEEGVVPVGAFDETDVSGEGTPHENMQPFGCVNKVIKF